MIIMRNPCPCLQAGKDRTKGHYRLVAVVNDGITEPFFVCDNHVHLYMGKKCFRVLDYVTHEPYELRPRQKVWRGYNGKNC